MLTKFNKGVITIRVASIMKNSIANGVGIRDVIFLQGCQHCCRGCHNPETWAIRGGYELTVDEILDELKDSPNPVTISGGEPLLQIPSLYDLLDGLERQGKRCWLYTGYTYNEIPQHILVELAFYVDVLVDGRFEIEKKDLRLAFRGSSNQRLIDLPSSIRHQEITLWRI
jgi:anaerobic ribonucleoside-triphosphate reductase activating protein